MLYRDETYVRDDDDDTALLVYQLEFEDSNVKYFKVREHSAHDSAVITAAVLVEKTYRRVRIDLNDDELEELIMALLHVKQSIRERKERELDF